MLSSWNDPLIHDVLHPEDEAEVITTAATRNAKNHGGYETFAYNSGYDGNWEWGIALAAGANITDAERNMRSLAPAWLCGWCVARVLFDVPGLFGWCLHLPGSGAPLPARKKTSTRQKKKHTHP